MHLVGGGLQQLRAGRREAAVSEGIEVALCTIICFDVVHIHPIANRARVARGGMVTVDPDPQGFPTHYPPIHCAIVGDCPVGIGAGQRVRLGRARIGTRSRAHNGTLALGQDVEIVVRFACSKRRQDHSIGSRLTSPARGGGLHVEMGIA
jgi:hypothetical protein